MRQLVLPILGALVVIGVLLALWQHLEHEGGQRQLLASTDLTSALLTSIAFAHDDPEPEAKDRCSTDFINPLEASYRLVADQCSLTNYATSCEKARPGLKNACLAECKVLGKIDKNDELTGEKCIGHLQGVEHEPFVSTQHCGKEGPKGNWVITCTVKAAPCFCDP